MNARLKSNEDKKSRNRIKQVVPRLTYGRFSVETAALKLYLARFPDAELIVALTVAPPVAVIELGRRRA